VDLLHTFCNVCWLLFPYYQCLQVMSLVMYYRINLTIIPSSTSRFLFISRQYMLMVRFSVLWGTVTCPEILWAFNQLAHHQVPVIWKGLAQWVLSDLLFLYSRLRVHLLLIFVIVTYMVGLCVKVGVCVLKTLACTLPFVDKAVEYSTTEPRFSYCFLL